MLLELNLPTAGRKHVLQDRLLAHFGIQDDDDNNDSDGVESIATALDCPVQAAYISRSLFTLKDVEGSVSNFAGTGSPDIDQWIQELKEFALTVQWSQLQLFIYPKQLLSGAAKSFIRSQVNIRNWDSLKAALRGEFAVKKSSAEVHRRLGQRAQRKEETLQEYLYALMEIAKPVNLDEESLIEYFVKGVPDAKANKIMLYQAKTIRDLKEQIEVYKKVRGSYKMQKDPKASTQNTSLYVNALSVGIRFI